MAPDSRITAFIEKQKCLTICTVKNGSPWSANCFYAFDSGTMTLVVKSSPGSRHTVEATANPEVAGTVLPDELKTAVIQGIQFTGNYSVVPVETFLHYSEIYYRKFPFARVFPGEFGIIALQQVKFTDNTLGFGTKVHWHK